MEQLLKKRSVMLTGCALDKQDECPISGEYTLPEYCPDIAVILKCFAYPRVMNRQWSGEQLLLDGNAVIRVLYLDEERCSIRSLEFTQPFTCTMRGEGRADNGAVNLTLSTKYLNCRAINPRRIEVRGAISVAAHAEYAMRKEVGVAVEDAALYTREEEIEITLPCAMSEKVLTVSESLEFPETLPPAEMLLGGECRAVVRECKLLSGKAIVKGQVHLHQLYCDNSDAEKVHSLDFTVPFSQILDVDGAMEGMPYLATVQVLSDTERCTVGPDGENTMLEVTVKLLIQIQVYCKEKLTVIKDAFHCHCPVSAQTEELKVCCLRGMRWEETVLPMQLAIPSGRWQEIVDVCVQLQEDVVTCNDDRAEAKGRMLVCVVACDTDGEIVYDEFVEDYTLTYDCTGNTCTIQAVPMDCQYRVVDKTLEVKVTMCVSIADMHCETIQVINELHLQRDIPYPKQKVTTLLYYADAGESVWDIGRHCHASPTCICEENELTDECVMEPMVLVVPIVN